MLVKVPCGKGEQIAEIPEAIRVVTGRLNAVKKVDDAATEIRRALKELAGPVDLHKIRNASTVAIAVSDITRPVPNRVILPVLIDWLNAAGVADDKIRLIIGGGLHRPATDEEMAIILGPDMFVRIKSYAHNARAADQLVYLGASAAGTPVYVNRLFYEADVRISTGMIDPHQFMGFTAGVKGVVIGLGGKETIEKNHARMFNEGADLGRVEDNPVHRDLEDIGRIIGLDMVLNVVLNERKEILKGAAGHPVQAHRAGVEFARQVFGVPLERADIVISSPGGFPKDINVYQAQKALTPAAQIVKPGGTIILVAECREGSGEELFEEEMALYSAPQDIVSSFKQKTFVAGAHKAYLWGRTLCAVRTVVVSGQIDAGLAKLLMVEVYPSLEEAVAEVLPAYPGDCTIAVLPYASSVIPLLAKEE